MKVILSQEERDEIIEKLTENQISFIRDKVKRGKKTVFARELAAKKGIFITESMNDREIEQLLDEWILIDYQDAGPNWRTKELHCECGRQLRYQYTIQHQTTQKVLRLGKEHFEEESGIDATIVSQILKGFEAIDYEQDEILLQIRNGWRLEKQFPYIPEDFMIPVEYREQINLGVPLLANQILRLQELISQHLVGQRLQNENTVQVDPIDRTISQASLLLEDTDITMENTGLELPHYYLAAIEGYIDSGVKSARAMCELLIKDFKFQPERYTTGKPRIYSKVCWYLDQLVANGQLHYVKSVFREDRIYHQGVSGI